MRKDVQEELLDLHRLLGVFCFSVSVYFCHCGFNEEKHCHPKLQTGNCPAYQCR